MAYRLSTTHYHILCITVICILIYINPIEKIMNLFPKYTFYYTEKDVKVSSQENSSIKKEYTNLYDKSLTNILGVGLYNVFSLKTDTGNFDIEYTTFFMGENDSIHFTTSVFSKDATIGFLNSGKYTYSITGGSGKFAGAKGYVVFNIKDKLRRVEIYM